MKRAFSIGIAALALLALALPPVFGMITESQVRARVAEIDGTAAWIGNVQSFERGWFRSSARIRLGLSPQYVPPLDSPSLAGGGAAIAALLQDVPLAHEFAHGPIAVLDGGHLGSAKLGAQV